jgi:hypothetical protein
MLSHGTNTGPGSLKQIDGLAHSTFSRITPRGHTLLAAIYKVPGTPTLGLYQPRALCAVAPLLLPGLRSEKTFGGDFGLPPGPIVGRWVAPLRTRGRKATKNRNGIREQNTLQEPWNQPSTGTL